MYSGKKTITKSDSPTNQITGMAQSRRDQFKPLAPFISSSPQFFSSQENPQHISERKTTRIRKIIRCCGCVTALLLILVVIAIVLGFTVYNVKEPRVRMNGVTLLSGTIGTNNNVTLLADVSVKNPNPFTFRFGNTTTAVYYGGKGIGEGTSPPGKAKARRTIRFNVTMEIMASKVLDNPSWITDSRDQALNISSYTRIDGKIKILNLFKRKVVVELNCTCQYNITTSLVTHGDSCIGYVEI